MWGKMLNRHLHPADSDRHRDGYGGSHLAWLNKPCGEAPSSISIELKSDKTSEEEMAQIRANEYNLPLCNDGCRIFRIGINFSSAARHLGAPLIEEVEV